MNQTLPTRADQLPIADTVKDLEVFGLKDGRVHRLREGGFQAYVNDETARRVEAGVAPYLDLIAHKANEDELAAVAKTGSYDDLAGKPTLGTAAAANTTDFASAEDGELAREALPAPELKLRANIVDFDYLRGSNDTEDVWPVLKALMENPGSERDALMSGARLFLRGGRAYRALTRTAITLPQFLHMEMEPGAFFDFSEVPGLFAENMLSYNGRYGYPTRPVNGDYLYGTTSVPFGSGVVASRGWKVGDRLLIRATEGLNDMAVGAFQTQSMDVNAPASFSFFSPGMELAVGDGVISTDNGKSYRTTVAHTAGETMNFANFVLTGLNAVGEDVYIETIVGDTIYLTAPLRYNYPEEGRPILTKYEDGGHHVFRDFKFLGNHPTDALDTGMWATAKSYQAGEMAYASSGIGGTNRYFLCLMPHISGTFSVDRAAGKWRDMGSERVLRFGVTDRVYVEGGRIDRASGYGIVVNAVADFGLRDFVGYGTNKRSSPGGVLAISGAYNHAHIDNVTLHSGSQPFMTTESGGEYGVGYGTTWRDCTEFGGASAFTQHWMEDGGSYFNCAHEGSPTLPGTGAAFDIRTPSRLSKCRVSNFNGRAVVLRHNFMGFGRSDGGARGTMIDGFNAHNCLSGIVLDDQMFNPGAGTMGWPNGSLEISNSRLTSIGGNGTAGAINLTWTQLETDVAGVYPVLGRLDFHDLFISMKSNQHAIQLHGRWDRPSLRDVNVDEAPGFTVSGSFRALVMSNGNAPSGENRPANPTVSNLRASSGWAIPQISALFTDTLPTVASAGTLAIDQSRRTFLVTGTTTINFIAGAGLLRGEEITLIFDQNPTVTHNNGGSGGASVALLNGAANFNATAGDTLKLVSNGTVWRQVGGAVI